MKFKLAVVSFISLIIFHNQIYAEVKSINLGEGTIVKGPTHWVRIEPVNPYIKLNIMAQRNTIHIGEPVAIRVEIKNVSNVVKEINYSNISVYCFDDTFKNTIFFQKSLNILDGKVQLEKNGSIIKELALDDIYKFKEPGTFILWACYNLPDDKGINSNDLKVIIKR